MPQTKEDNYTAEELSPYTTCEVCGKSVHISNTFLEDDKIVCPGCNPEDEE